MFINKCHVENWTSSLVFGLFELEDPSTRFQGIPRATILKAVALCLPKYDPTPSMKALSEDLLLSNAPHFNKICWKFLLNVIFNYYKIMTLQNAFFFTCEWGKRDQWLFYFFFVKVNILHLIQYNLEIYIYIYIFFFQTNKKKTLKIRNNCNFFLNMKEKKIRDSLFEFKMKFIIWQLWLYF